MSMLIAAPFVCALVILVCIGVNARSAMRAYEAGDWPLFHRAFRVLTIGLVFLVFALGWAAFLFFVWPSS